MKTIAYFRRFVMLSIAFVTAITTSQAQYDGRQLDWSSNINSNSGDNTRGDINITSRNEYISASIQATSATNDDIYVRLLDGEGNAKWSFVWGGSQDETVEEIKELADGSFILVGSTKSFGAGGQDILLMKMNYSGTILWTRYFGNSGNQTGLSVIELPGGDLVFGGTWLYRTNSNGTSIGWTNTSIESNSLKYTDDGNIISCKPGKLQKINTGGGLIWTKNIKVDLSGLRDLHPKEVQQTPDGGYILGGSIFAGDWSPAMVKTDANGDTDWESWYSQYHFSLICGPQISAYGEDLVQTNDGGYALAAYSQIRGCTSILGIGLFFIKVDANGGDLIFSQPGQWGLIEAGGTGAENVTNAITYASVCNEGFVIQQNNTFNTGATKFWDKDQNTLTAYDELSPEISGPVTWNTDRIVAGNVTVEPGGTLTIDASARIQMSLCSKIIVNPGGKLIIDNATVTGADNLAAMWKGIQLEGNSNLQQTTSNQGVVQIKNNSLIEHAVNGIRTIGHDYRGYVWFTSGGIINASNSQFLNCGRGVEYMSFQNFHPLITNELSNLGNFTNVSFTTDSDLRRNNPYPYVHISMWDVRNVQIRGCTFENTRTDLATLPITDRGMGIVSVDADPRIRGIQNIFSGAVTDRNEFNDLYIGVTAYGGTSWSDVEVKNNTFNNCPYGVRLEGSNYGIVALNEFNIPRADNSVFGYNYAFGVLANGAYGFNIEGNDFNDLGTPLFGANIGVYSENSSTVSGGSIFLNNMNNNDLGTQTLANNSLLTIDCNSYNRGANTQVDVHHATGVLATQGNCGVKPANNAFVGACSAGIPQLYKNPAATGFNYDYEAGTVNPTCVGPGITITNCPGSAPDNNCTPTITNGPLIAKPIRLAEAKMLVGVANDNIAEAKDKVDGGDTQGLLDDIASNMNSGQLKNTLLDHSPYLSDKVLIAAAKRQPKMSNGHIKQVMVANSPLAPNVLNTVQALNLPNGIWNQILNAQTGQSSMEELQAEITYHSADKMVHLNNVVRIYMEDNEEEEVIDYLTQEGSLQSICALVKIQLTRQPTVADAHMQVLRERADEIEFEDPTSLEPKELRAFCDFHERVRAIILQPGGYFEMTPDQIAQMESFANDNLSISANARGILDLINETARVISGVDPIFGQTNSAFVGASNYNANTMGIELAAYPNPFSYSTTIAVEMPENVNGQLIVTDMMGKVVANHAVNAYNNQVVLEANGWTSGVYFVNLVVNGERVATERINYAR